MTDIVAVIVQLCLSFCDPIDCSPPISSVHGILQARILANQKWSGLLFPSPGDLPDPGIEPESPALQANSLRLSHQGIANASCISWGICTSSQYGILRLKSLKLHPSLFPPNLATKVYVHGWQSPPVDSQIFCQFHGLLAILFLSSESFLEGSWLSWNHAFENLFSDLCPPPDSAGEFQEVTPALFWLWKVGGAWCSGMKRLESISFHWTHFIQTWGVPSFIRIRLPPTVVWRMFHMYFSST